MDRLHSDLEDVSNVILVTDAAGLNTSAVTNLHNGQIEQVVKKVQFLISILNLKKLFSFELKSVLWRASQCDKRLLWRTQFQ